MEAAVILARCTDQGRIYGIRIQKMSDGDWWRTWAFPVDAYRASKEGFGVTRAVGSLNCTEEYPGCPYCGKFGFVMCGNCKKLTCYNGEEWFTCRWCGIQSNDIEHADRFSVSGGDI